MSIAIRFLDQLYYQEPQALITAAFAVQYLTEDNCRAIFFAYRRPIHQLQYWQHYKSSHTVTISTLRDVDSLIASIECAQ